MGTWNGQSMAEWRHQQRAYDVEQQRRRDLGIPDNGHGSNNQERPMKDITPKPDPAVTRSTKMISGPIKRINKC